ncbi:MAG: hypothetical protein R2861_02860 [Desulfobacterales bacterium]
MPRPKPANWWKKRIRKFLKKSEHARTFNVFVDDEFYEVKVDEPDGPPMSNLCTAPGTGGTFSAHASDAGSASPQGISGTRAQSTAGAQAKNPGTRVQARAQSGAGRG